MDSDFEPLLDNLLTIADDRNFASLRVEAISWMPHITHKNKRVKETLKRLSQDDRHKKVEKAAQEALDKMALPRR